MQPTSLRNNKVKLSSIINYNKEYESNEDLLEIADLVEREVNPDEIKSAVDKWLNKIESVSERIKFLENAYSICDVVKPFGRSEDDQIEIATKHISDLLKGINQNRSIQFKYDISNIINQEIRNISEQNDGESTSNEDAVSRIGQEIKKKNFEISSSLLKNNSHQFLENKHNEGFSINRVASYAVRNHILPKLFEDASFDVQNCLLLEHVNTFIELLTASNYQNPGNITIKNLSINDQLAHISNKFLNQLKSTEKVKDLSLNELKQQLEGNSSYDLLAKKSLCELYNTWIKDNVCLSKVELFLFYQFMTDSRFEDENVYTRDTYVHLIPKGMYAHDIFLDADCAITSVLAHCNKNLFINKQNNDAISSQQKEHTTGKLQVHESEYKRMYTSGTENNCLLYAAREGRIRYLNRESVFTAKAIEEHLTKMFDAKNLGFEIGNPFQAFLNNLEAIYGHCHFAKSKEKIQAISASGDNPMEYQESFISCIADELAKYIHTSECFLDAEIAAPILAAHLGRSMIIIKKDSSKQNRNPSGYFFTVISSQGELMSSGDLTNTEFLELEKRDDPILIYNEGNYHFEWMKKIESSEISIDKVDPDQELPDCSFSLSGDSSNSSVSGDDDSSSDYSVNDEHFYNQEFNV